MTELQVIAAGEYAIGDAERRGIFVTLTAPGDAACLVCGGTGTVPCWSPGGPCAVLPVECDACGPCQACCAGVR